MSEDITGVQNGDCMFVIDDLMNMIVPFEFPFEKSKLKGRWYKYKTTSPNYIRQIMAHVRELRELVLDLTIQIEAAKSGDPEIPKLLLARDDAEDQLQRAPYDWMADAVVEWNAVGVDKEVLVISKETLDTFPLLFLRRLNEFFSKERTGENPT